MARLVLGDAPTSTRTESAAALAGLLAEITEAGATLQSVETHWPNLETLFMELTGRQLRDG